jgi:flagellar biosynthesis protein FliQ
MDRRHILKSRIAMVVVLLALVAGVAVAQQAADQIDNKSSMYVRTVFLDTIYTHRLGFKVTYTADDYSRQTVYLPQNWFTEAGGQGQMVSTSSEAAPYMSVFYDNGEFSHVRLFVPRNRDHIAWESLEDIEGEADNFNVETVSLD